MTVNGWENWHTFEANNWLMNDQVAYLALEMVTTYHGVAGIFYEFFGDMDLGIDTKLVNWREIYENSK